MSIRRGISVDAKICTLSAAVEDADEGTSSDDGSRFARLPCPIIPSPEVESGYCGSEDIEYDSLGFRYEGLRVIGAAVRSR